jgi:hypothetical protein
MSDVNVLVDLHCGSTCEEWVTVYPSGRLSYHVENNGHRVLRYGVEASDEDVDLAYIEKYYPHKVAEVKAAIEQVRLKVAP